MEQILEFLEQLRQNNNKFWFDAHRAEYLQAKNTFNEIAVRLIQGIRKFDPSIGPLTIQDCSFRINRDIRFSKDKSPYKTHFGLFVCPGGKKSGFSGYYFHVTPESGDSQFEVPLLAAGDYMCDPKVLRILREDIELGGDEFDSIVKSAGRRWYLDKSQSLKRVPQGIHRRRTQRRVPQAPAFLPDDRPGQGIPHLPRPCGQPAEALQEDKALRSLRQQGHRVLPRRRITKPN